MTFSENLGGETDPAAAGQNFVVERNFSCIIAESIDATKVD